MKCPHCHGTGQLVASVGVLIKTAREAKGMTQAELSALVGVTRPQIANMEADRSDLPLSRLIMLASALSVQPADLIPVGQEPTR